MTTKHLTPTECDGVTEKPELTQNVRETIEYKEAVADPESDKLRDSLAALAGIGKQHILPKNK